MQHLRLPVATAVLVALALAQGAVAKTGLEARVAYYPSHDKLEVRTEERLLQTEDGEVGLRGQYFDNPDLAGEPVVTRVDEQLDFTWKNRPHRELPKDGFSVRWTGLIAVPWKDTYRLTFRHADGMRVWLDGEQIFDHWERKNGKPSYDLSLDPNDPNKLRIELRNRKGHAQAILRIKPLNVVEGNLFQTPDGKPGLKRAYFFSPELEGEPVKTDIVQRVYHKSVLSPHKRKQDPSGKDYGVRWTGRFGPVPKTGTYLFEIRHVEGLRLWVDDELRFEQWPKGGGSHTIRVPLEAGQTVPFRLEMNHLNRYASAIPGYVEMNPPRMTLETARGEALETTGVVKIHDGAGNTVQRHEFPLRRFGDRRIVAIDPLEAGEYTISVSGPSYVNADETRILHQDFAWENNELGITDEIYEPFEPIAVNGRTVAVVLRRYELSGLGLPAQVHARGQGRDDEYKPLLAAPTNLRINGQVSPQGEGRFTETSDQRAVYEGAASHPAVNIETRTTTEFDGCMRVDLTLKPGAEKQTLDSLTLEIPLRDEMASLYHVVKGTLPIRNNPAGATPAGTGEVWSSQQMKSGWPGNFKPYLWLGGPARGLSWFADNEKGWVMDWSNQPACQTLHREDGVLTLRVHLVQRPITLKEPRTITFGLMASPAKPMREDWRRIGRPDSKSIRFRMGQLFGLNGVYAAKYPRNKDFSPFEQFYAARKGENLKDISIGGFIDDWSKRNLHDGMTDGLTHRFRHLMRRVLLDGKELGRKAQPQYFTAYFEEFRGTVPWHEEMKTYWSEWTRKFEITPVTRLTGSQANWPIKTRHLYHFRGTGAVVPSYQDFACYFGAKWLRQSVGLYFDNAFLEPAYNPINTSAYVREDGEIQPSAQIWARRTYLRRIWNLHQELYKPETPQIMMLHMTNTHVLPYVVWNESNLDLEWKMGGNRPLQAKFAPDLLRAESIGLQTGNVPLGMVARGLKRTDGMSKERYQFLERSHRGGLLVHEIKDGRNVNSRPPFQAMIDFGYGLDDCRVYNYWDQTAPLSVSDPRCKWLLMQRDGKLLVLLCTWNDQDATVTLDLDARVRPSGEVRAIDPESSEAVPGSKGRYRVEMPGYGVRLLRFEPATAKAANAPGTSEAAAETP